MKTLAQVYKKPGFFQVDGARDKARPFPGKFPTRWAISSMDEEAKDIRWHIISKPNRHLMNKVLHLRIGWLLLIEFDRGGAIRTMTRQLPQPILKPTQLNRNLSYYYYPFSFYADDFFAPWRPGPMYRLPIPGLSIYSSYKDILGQNLSGFRDYLGWLRKTQPIEGFNWKKLPKLPGMKKYAARCPNCSLFSERPLSYQGLLINCDHCGWRFKAQL